MFDIEKTLAEYGLTPTTYEEMLRQCSDKVHKISDVDWGEISSKYGINMNPDTLRKAQQPPLFGGTFVREYFLWKEAQGKNDDSYMKEVQVQKDEIYKAKRQMYDQRREYNKLLTQDARAEHLTEELIKVANSLNKEQPLTFDRSFYVDSNNNAVMCWADWHYGMITDNIWNTYDTEEASARLSTYCSE
jgi:hypothetical protein